MTAPAANLKNSGNDIIKATKDDVYTTSIDSTILISEIYVGQELQILGWADESSDNRNHEISANDSFIKFEVGFL